MHKQFRIYVNTFERFYTYKVLHIFGILNSYTTKYGFQFFSTGHLKNLLLVSSHRLESFVNFFETVCTLYFAYIYNI
jgi:hypothetical protein